MEACPPRPGRLESFHLELTSLLVCMSRRLREGWGGTCWGHMMAPGRSHTPRIEETQALETWVRAGARGPADLVQGCGCGLAA